MGLGIGFIIGCFKMDEPADDLTHVAVTASE